MRTADINESTKGAVPVPGKRSKVANNLKIIHFFGYLSFLTVIYELINLKFESYK